LVASSAQKAFGQAVQTDELMVMWPCWYNSLGLWRAACTRPFTRSIRQLKTATAEGANVKSRLLQLHSEASDLASGPEQRAATTALFRILLQHVCLVLAEVILEKRRRAAVRRDETPLPISSLRMPADGTLVAAALDMLVTAENEHLTGYSRPIWKDSTEDRPCWALLGPSERKNAERLMQALVSMRNDGVEGHGIAGENDGAAEADAVLHLIEAFTPLLPTIDSTGSSFTLPLPNGEAYAVQLLKPVQGNLICYRNIKRSTAGKCVVKAQVERGWFRRDEVSYEAPDLFESGVNGEINRYEVISTAREDWSPLALVPDRLTDNFTGRERELEELREWLDDTESRACMLYGDGGIGKTTLAIEFVQRLLEGRITSSYRPELITFYTAKKTRWGINGLEVIRLNEVGIADVATFIPRALEGGRLDRAWYSKPSEELIQMVAGYLAETWGANRNSHLLILDNTETMASNADEVKILAKHIRELSRRVGRVLLTSRRREAIEAQQIEIKPLDEEESLAFLKARALALSRKSILDAGPSTLKKYGRLLGNKPLVLEVFVQALGDHGIGLEKAFDRVMRMQTQDLGEFLYADAWNRMSQSMQHLLLLMTRITDIHDDTLLKLCCGQVGISVLEAYEALEESRGIAQLSKFSDNLQILISPEFLKFCNERKISVNGNVLPTDAAIERVRSRYNEFLRSKSSMVNDRVARAYRHPYARAAHSAFQEGRDDDCEAFYDLAVNADVGNGWLYDRFAFFLSSRRRTRQDEALDWAKKATALIPDDPDAWFTRGAIESKRGVVAEAVASLDRAASLGKHKHLCLLQQAYAYVNDTPPNNALARAKLDAAEAAAPSNDSLLWKFRGEVAAVRRRVNPRE
jgi:tetratricopeptide (TPR) repeat protein